MTVLERRPPMPTSNPAGSVRERSGATRPRPRDQAGAATILAVAMLGLLVTVSVAAAGVVGVVAAHRRAQSAADLSALAGAGALQDGVDPCRRADDIARRNGSRLRQCEIDDWTVAVMVSGTVRLPGGALELRARGRAGPVSELSVR
jgi:secretion/DNA translocation related TadE-like protein